MPPSSLPRSRLSFWTGTRPGLEALALVSVPAFALGAAIGAFTEPRLGFVLSLGLLAIGTRLVLALRRRRAAARDDGPGSGATPVRSPD